MKANKAKGNLGFTVIELMIVIMIVAILAALAYPSYVDYVRKSKRGDAQQLLMNWSINQEIWRSNNTSYAGLDDLPAPTTDENYSYDFAAEPTATTYSLRATAQGDQKNDKSRSGTAGECEILTLDQNGQKLPPACWE